ncbi:MAG: hypothetical protein RBQ96_02835 [Candidatus Methanomethylophilaceae archaeon]|nr:hypothetical protein [Candidatus Methanomethylophilaceae archaeon]MDY0252030.1 hypothetical protein [Candidatus Methanomethylophilaceae archaeon]
MDADAIIASLKDHSPEIVLVIGGLIAIFIVYLYLKDDGSTKYKFTVFLGLAAGVAMIYIAAVTWSGLALATAIIVAVGGFALVIRPFREVHFSVILALFVMVVVYILLGELDGTMIYGIDISFLASGYVRIAIALIAGAIVYMITNFIEEIIRLFGKILNWWPFLLIIGLICLAEGAIVFLGYGSVYEIYLDYTS